MNVPIIVSAEGLLHNLRPIADRNPYAALMVALIEAAPDPDATARMVLDEAIRKLEETVALMERYEPQIAAIIAHQAESN